MDNVRFALSRMLFQLLTLLLLADMFLATVSLDTRAQPAIIQFWTWGGSELEYATGVAVDPDGNRYVTGVTYSFGAGSGDVFLTRFNANGDLSWQRTWGGANTDYSLGIAVDTSYNIYVTGETFSFINPPGREVLSQGFLLKFDAEGGLQWQQVWGGSPDDTAYGLAIDSSANIYVTGTTNSSAGDSDIFLLKVDESGNMVWENTFGSDVADWGWAIAVDNFHNAYIAGFYVGSTFDDSLLLKIDSTGNLVYQRSWGGLDSDAFLDVAVGPSGDAYVTGRTRSFGAGRNDAVVLRVDSTGTLVWQATWGGINDEFGGAIAVEPSGAITIAGGTTSFGAGSDDALLLTLNSEGDPLRQNTWGGANRGWGSSISLDSLGHVFVAGSVNEAPPYVLGSSGNPSLGRPSIDLGVPSISSGKPNFTLTPVAGILGTPNGSLSYAGGFDGFLFDYAILSPSRLTLSVDAATSYLGFSVLLQGHLTDAMGNPISGVSITLEYRVPEVQDYVIMTSAKTELDGTYRANWIPSATGNFVLRARFDGNLAYYQSNAMANFAVVPFAQRVVFSVESNVTISDLVFDSTTGVLSFKISGPQATIGSVRVFVAKSLVPSVADLKLLLNGTETTFTHKEDPDSFVIFFSQHLSSFSVRLTGLSTASTAEPLPSYVLVFAILVSAILGGIIVVRRGRRAVRFP